MTVDVLAWQRALAAQTAISVTEFYTYRGTVAVTVRQAVSAHAVPVTLVAWRSGRGDDSFEFKIEPHPTKAGEATRARIVEILTEHATRLAYRASVERAHTRGRRP